VRWAADGTIRRAFDALAGGGGDEVWLIDGMFVRARAGGDLVGRGRRGKGTTVMLVCDLSSAPVGVLLAPAQRQEVGLAQPTLACAKSVREGLRACW
jgi:hypothetical protein